MMFSESFDGYAAPVTSATVGMVSAGWVNTNDGGTTGSLVAGRFGGQALRMNSGTANGAQFARFYKALGFASNVFSMSFAFRVNAGGDSVYMGLGDAGNPQINIACSSTGALTLRRGGNTTSLGGTVLWSSDVGAFPQGIWHTARLRGVIHASAGELELMIDNEVVATLTGINTQQTANAYVSTVLINARGSSMDVDDIVVIDDDSAFLPECRIQQLLPSVDGGTLNLVPSTGVSHFAVVDEAVVSTADYLQGTLDGEHDLLGVQDLAAVPGSILGVKVIGWAAKTDAASRAWNLGIKSGATVDDGADLSLTTDPQYAERLFETDPNTALEWTQAGVNALELKPTVIVP